MPVLWYCRKGIILWVLHSAGKAACTLQVPHVLMRNGVCMYFLSFWLACFCSLCNFQLLYFSRRVSQTLCRVIFICSVSWVGWRFSGSLLFVLPSDYRLPLAGDLEIFGHYGWRYYELMRGTNEILASNYDIAKGQTRALWDPHLGSSQFFVYYYS